MKKHNTFFTVFARIIALAILLHAPVHAQNYPVQTHVVTSGPYFNYLSYYGDQNNHLQVIVTLLDFNQPPVMARLRIRIEGPGYELYTHPNAVVGQPFLLEGGVPVNLSGIDLLPYLQQNNLIVSPQGLDINALPEGFTTICVDVIKDGTNQEVLSTNNCTAFSLFKFQPPQTFLPQCATELDTTQMYYTFQWSPPIGYTPDLNSELLYTFSLYRWNDPSNYSIFTTDQGLVWRETDLTMAQTQVSDLDVAFELGGLYVWRVEAQITSNGMPVNMVLNNGFSENCTFTFGQAQTLAEALSDGLYIDLFAEPSAENKGKAYWTVIDNTPNVGLSTFDEFFVEYRKQPTGNEGFEMQWFPETVSDFDLFIYQLEPSTTYEVKVSGVVGGVVGDPTPVKTFTTPAARVYACGESDLPFLPSTFTPLENALAGIQVQIGQFKMDISELTQTGSIGHYEGKGTIPIAFLGGAKAKVTFEDILIDTEYRVREGRVDVITQGLENWLLEQYEQFIDPIYVNGTVDSAYVDANGVAWVVVDGVNQQFTFDPPTYPIIINDASGYQYTIYPNGTIVVSIYLEVSEYWTVSPSEVVHFGQNETETRGFDGKEFMQWHEQYEVMQLSDSSFYFVANKSMAANEGDVVNVQLPPMNSGVSFQFADGSPVTSSSLNGSWLGDAPHGLAETKTLNIPARSAGEYQIHAYANNQKVGQLNVFVYGKKEKELVVVPLVSNFNYTDTQIEAELDATLGEANIDVDVTLAPQWNDTTFTASTTISLPSDVGLMNKYSEEMKALRDAYLAANPNADKTKFYLFVVAGFDDPSEMGYMVRGRSMGFLRAGNPTFLETLSHELGHGMGALEHSWKNNGPSKGTTRNLMDYDSTDIAAATPKNNLTQAQWKELRDADFVPSLWDEVEDGSLYGVNPVAFASLMDTITNTYTFLRVNGRYITLPSTIKSVTFSTMDRAIDQLSENPTDVFAPVGTLISFTDHANITYTSSEVGMFRVWENGDWAGYYLGDTLDKLYQPTSAITTIFAPLDGIIVVKFFKVSSPIAQTNYDLVEDQALSRYIIFETGDMSLRTLTFLEFIENYRLPNFPVVQANPTSIDFNEDFCPIVITNGNGTPLYNFNSFELFLEMTERLNSMNAWLTYLVIFNMKPSESNSFSNCLDGQVQSVLNEQENAPNEQTDLLNQTTTPSSTIVPIYEVPLQDLQIAFDNLDLRDEGSFSEIYAAREDITTKVLGQAIQQAYLMNNAEEIALLKMTINEKMPTLVAQKINSVPECLLYSLTAGERLTAFDKLNDDSYWHLIPAILRNIPETQRVAQELSIVNGFRANNYERLRDLIPQTSEWTDFDDQSEMPVITEIFELLTVYTRRHQSNFPESTTYETISFLSDYMPGQIPYQYEIQLPHVGIPVTIGVQGQADIDLGMIDYVDLGIHQGNHIHVKTTANHPKFPLRLKANGKIEVIQSFKLVDQFTGSSISQAYTYGNTPPNNDYIYQINATYELDPSDVIDVVIGANSTAGYDKGDIISVPAMTALLIQQNIDNADFNNAVRDIVDAIEIGGGIVAIVAIPFTGGASFMTYVEITAGIAGAVDQVFAQQEYAMTSQEVANAQYLNDWKKIKASIDLVLAGSSVATLSLSSGMGAAATVSTSSVGYITTGLRLRGAQHISMALSLKRSLRMANTADNFTHPYLIQKSLAFKNSFRLGQVIAPVSATTISASLAAKLGNTSNLQNWLNANSSTLGNSTPSLLSQLDATIGTKTVLESLEDAQGRFVTVIERPNQTNIVGAIQKDVTGNFIFVEYSPAYNPFLNPNIPVPLSYNKLVPDYIGTQYLHPDNASYILNNQGNGVLIEMQGTRGKDFTEAFKKLGIKASDADDYTWHHMDDFQIINGKPYCTMQLVLSEGHGGAGISGMAHSGSVAQWKAYFGLTIYP